MFKKLLVVTLALFPFFSKAGYSPVELEDESHDVVYIQVNGETFELLGKSKEKLMELLEEAYLEEIDEEDLGNVKMAGAYITQSNDDNIEE